MSSKLCCISNEDISGLEGISDPCKKENAELWEI